MSASVHSKTIKNRSATTVPWQGLDHRQMRAYIKTVGVDSLPRRTDKIVYADDLLAPIIDLHISRESLEARPLLKKLLPAEFFKTTTEQPKAKGPPPGPPQASLADLRNLPPNQCRCLLPRASCGDCGLGYEQRLAVLKHLLDQVPGPAPASTGRQLQQNPSTVSSTASKKRKAETNTDLLLFSDSEDEVWEEDCRGDASAKLS